MIITNSSLYRFAILIFVLPLTCLAQDVKKIKKQTLFDYVEYSVLKRNHATKQGMYVRLTQYKDDTLVVGAYDNNQKNGIWRYFERGTLIARGKYDHDKKIGVWDYFENESLQTKYDYSNDSLAFQVPSMYDYELIKPNGNQITKLSRAPIFLDFHVQMYERLQYPAAAMRMGVLGDVIVSFIVSEDGTTSDYKIEQDIGSDCGKELLNAVKTLNKNWMPGILDGKPVAVRIQVLGKFILFDNGEKTIAVRKI